MNSSLKMKTVVFSAFAVCALITAFALSSFSDSSETQSTSFEVAVESLDSSGDLDLSTIDISVEDCIEYCKNNPNCTPEECKAYCKQNCSSSCTDAQIEQCCATTCGKGC